MLDEIKRIAKEVRNNAVSVLTKPKYGFREDLHGACGICSMALKESIEKIIPEAKPIVVHGLFRKINWHCWVEINGSIIDVTATQFGVKEKVLITESQDERYNPNVLVHNFEHFHDWQQPYKPTPHKVKRITI